LRNTFLHRSVNWGTKRAKLVNHPWGEKYRKYFGGKRGKQATKMSRTPTLKKLGKVGVQPKGTGGNLCKKSTLVNLWSVGGLGTK